LQPLLTATAQRHQHLCPRQVLGIRLGLAGLVGLGLIPPNYTNYFDNHSKRLLTIVETDGCGADGVAIATRCHVGRRTLRVLDYGKVAATLIDTWHDRAVRVAPSPHSRRLAQQFAVDAESKWHGYLLGYQRIPDADLIRMTPVTLTQTIAEILSKPNMRVNCAECGEEIMNERELIVDGRPLCQQCAGRGYYQPGDGA
jgi:formylmethanofuran dehydrogenase subunit E